MVIDEKTVFIAALALSDAKERAVYLEEACAGHPELLGRLRDLLSAHEESRGPLDAAPAGLGVTVDLPRVTETAGALIGPYKLLQQIGEGGMGTVFMAEQLERVKRKVALKIIKAGMDSRQVVARFEAERQALAMMDHVNIARVFDGGTTENGRPYFVMELVHGVPITMYCDDNHLTPRQRLELFVPVCQAIQHAHQKGIIHRDIKPSNVMVTLYDGKPVPKVIDFGVAKATEQKLTERTLFTHYGTMVGTLEYMSPEQAEMSALGVDTRSDVYSLGVLLYELLTGSTPLTHKRMKGTAYAEILRMIKEEEPPKPSTRLSDSGETLASISARRHTEPAKLTKLMRGELDWIVLKTLEKDRNRRYETASGFAADVQRYLNDEAVQACPPSAGYRFRKFVRRNKRSLATFTLLGMMLLVAVGAVAGSLGWVTRDRAARRMAVEQAVAQALEDSEESQKQAKWKEALVAVERAQAALAIGEAHPDLQQQVNDQLADLHMIQRLEELRAWWGDHPGHENQHRAYSRVFADFGIDVKNLGPAEVATQIRRRPRTAVRMAAGLDEWAMVLRDWAVLSPNPNNDPATWKGLLEAARLADPDLWRCELRQLMGREDLNALRKLADASDIAALPIQSLHLMANALVFGGDAPACVAWLRKAHRQHPGDTLNSFHLAYHLGNLPSADRADVLRFAEAALAARPQSPSMYVMVGYCLDKLERYEEAIANYRRALELKPDAPEIHRYVGFSLARLGRHGEAIEYFANALDIQLRLLGKDHPDTLASMKALADGYTNLGRHAEAIKLREETLALMKAKLGQNHPDSLEYMVSLARSLIRLDRVVEAMPIIDEALKHPAGKTLVQRLRVIVLYPCMKHFKERRDAGGCRQTAELWERLSLAEADVLYDAACMRAVTARVIAEDKTRGADAAPLAKAEADRAMAWLKRAAAAGFRDPTHIMQDTDLDALREREDFKNLLAELEGKLNKPAEAKK